MEQSPKFNSKSQTKSSKSQDFYEKVDFCGLWMLCGCNVDAMWMFRSLEKCQKSRFVGLRGGARARAPWGPKGPGPLGAPRASSNSRKSTFSHFPRLLTATERPHSVHRASTPKKSRFVYKILSFLISSELFRLQKSLWGRKPTYFYQENKDKSRKTWKFRKNGKSKNLKIPGNKH